MLKIIESEFLNRIYMAHRLMLLFTRTKGIPKVEPGQIQVGGRHEQRRLIRNDVDAYQEGSDILDFVNLKKSKGNYIADVDGNTLLDVCGTELNPLGYNHDAFVNRIHSKEFDSAFINSNLTANEISTKEFQSIAQKLLAPLAPAGLPAFTFTRGGQGVEKAILTAMAERGKAQWTALGFEGSTHGNHTSFVLSQFRGSPRLPSLNWPTLAYPTCGTESSVLENIRTNLNRQKSKGSPVAAVVIEPMQSTTGHAASDSFLKELRSLTKENEAALIVDAEETSCGVTGKSFWGFTGEADYLVFGKRSQIEGFYSRPSSQNSTITLGGDYLRLLQFQVINDVIARDKLIEKVDNVGASFRKSLESAVSKKSELKGVRGLGTSLFIDTQDGETAFKLEQHMLKEGVLVKLNGTHGIAVKPSLLFDTKHVDQFVSALSRF